MGNEGSEVRARRERLQMTISQLAEEAGISRDTLSDMESERKNFTQLTLSKVQQALDRLEDEAGIDAPLPSSAEGLVEFEVDGNRVIVRGPIADREALAETVARLILDIRRKDDQPDNPRES